MQLTGGGTFRRWGLVGGSYVIGSGLLKGILELSPFLSLYFFPDL
jgi:hypothetical protein